MSANNPLKIRFKTRVRIKAKVKGGFLAVPDLSTRPKMTPPTTPIMVARVIPEDLAHDTIFSLDGRSEK